MSTTAATPLPDAPPPELIRRLAETARAHPLREKLVVAPSYRVGGEWLDWTARCMCTPAGEPGGGAGGFINMRPVTPKRLLLDFAEEELRRRNLRLPGAEESLALAGRAFASITPASRTTSRASSRTTAQAPSDTGYFTKLPASLSLVETLAKALDELEAAGFSSLNRAERHFASREKFDELSRLHRAYRRERTRAGIADRATLLDCALTALRNRIGGSTQSHNQSQSGDGKNNPLPLLLVPESITESADTESLALIEAWPRESLRVFPEDEGAPVAAVATRVADSTANEARQVFRTIFSERIPLDTVEIITTDAHTYIPAICDAAVEIFDCPAEELPLTFHAGIPAAHARPARLLAAWLAWLGDGLPPAGLADMLRDSLLGTGWQKKAPDISPEDLAARLLQLPVHGAPEEYRNALGKHRNNAGAGVSGNSNGSNDDTSDGDKNNAETQLRKAESWLARALPEILPLANGGHALDLDNAPVVLRAAARLLKLADHTASKLDAYANVALSAAIEAWLPHCDWPGFAPAAWLENTVATLQIMGLGPQPGRAHVSDIHAGGFTGREHTFILGLDEARFPGGARQDPVLLDKERQRLSRALPVAAHARERRENAMRRLLARLRGTVMLSHARHDAEADREQYPALLFTRFAEKDSGKETPPEPPPPQNNAAAVLRPAAAEEATTPRDALLWTVLAQPRNTLTPADFAPWFPALAQGEIARAARAAGGFGIYSGHVPEAGADYTRAPWAISPTDMEVLAANPAEYFYKRVLKITPPDRFEPTPGKWLEGNERGNLLHDLFQDFVGELITGEDTVTPASFARHRERLLDMLEGSIARFRHRKPVRDTLAYARERGELIEACAIFLIAEIDRNAEAHPIRLEAALGGAKEDAPPWEQVEAIELPLPDGTTLPLKGRIDRIDRLHPDRGEGGGGLVIWDYKTGRSDKFSAADPFQDGRHLQPLLYSLMLDHALRANGLPEPVRRFSYFFPMPRDEGRTLSYAWSELVPAGLEIVMRLHAHLREGRYPLSPIQKDRAFSDYAPLFTDF